MVFKSMWAIGAVALMNSATSVAADEDWPYMIPKEDVMAQRHRMEAIAERNRWREENLDEEDKQSRKENLYDYQKRLEALQIVKLRLPSDEEAVFFGVLCVMTLVALTYRVHHAFGRLVSQSATVLIHSYYSFPLVFLAYFLLKVLPARIAAWTNFVLAWGMLYLTGYMDGFWDQFLPHLGLVDELDTVGIIGSMVLVTKCMAFFVTLRVIAFSWDYADYEATALDAGFIDYFEYCFALPGLCTGPFYPYWFFRQSMKIVFPIHWKRDVFPRVFKAVLCAGLYIALNSCFPVALLWTEDFRVSPTYLQMSMIALSWQSLRVKCILVWLVAEIAVIFSGMMPSGQDEEFAREGWGHNVRFVDMLSQATFLGHMVNWHKSLVGFFHVYVHERLSLVFPQWFTMLSVLTLMTYWHGAYLGTFVAFGTWAFILLCEVALMHAMHTIVDLQTMNPPMIVRIFFRVFGILHVNFLVGYGFVAYAVPYSLPLIFYTWWSTGRRKNWRTKICFM